MDVEATNREVLDKLVSKLREESDSLADTRRNLEAEIGRKRTQLAQITDSIAAEEFRLQDVKRRVQKEVDTVTQAMNDQLLQVRSRAADAIAQAKQDAERAEKRKEQAMESERTASERATAASAKARSAEDRLAQVLGAMQQAKAAVQSWPL